MPVAESEVAGDEEFRTGFAAGAEFAFLARRIRHLAPDWAGAAIDAGRWKVI